MPRADTDTAPYHFNVGDRVRVKDAPNLFYSRTQMNVRGITGTIAERAYQTLAPEDEAWNRDDAPAVLHRSVPAEGSMAGVFVR
jgi:hypothetical protein